MLVQADNLEALIRTICRSAGSDEREADMVARNLTRANLTGHDSHGVGMIPAYVLAAVQGDMAIGQHVSVISENGPIVVLDGNMGYGQVTGHEAMEIGLARVAEHGVAVVALRNTSSGGKGSIVQRSLVVNLKAENVTPGSCPAGTSSDPVSVHVLLTDDDGDVIVDVTKDAVCVASQPNNMKLTATYKVKNCAGSVAPAGTSFGDVDVLVELPNDTFTATRKVHCQGM